MIDHDKLSRALHLSSCQIVDGTTVVSGLRAKSAGVFGGVAYEGELDGVQRHFGSRGEG